MDSSRVLIPVYDDWAAVARVISELDATGRHFDVLLVDDGSVTPCPAALTGIAGAGAIEVLRLRRNLGHQRAIAIGLAYLESRGDQSPVVIMDGDGEDQPADVLKLLDAADATPGRIVFAERTRRSEGWLFTHLVSRLSRGPLAADRRACARRKLQRRPVVAAPPAGCGLGIVEPLRRRGVQVASALHDVAYGQGRPLRGELDDELCSARDARPECDGGVRRSDRRQVADRHGADGTRGGRRAHFRAWPVRSSPAKVCRRGGRSRSWCSSRSCSRRSPCR